MKTKDFPFAVQLANTMNWNMTVEDFELAVKLEPDGCFILLQGSERLGLATSISFEKVGWFGNLIVREDHRRKGAGSLLVNHAINYLTGKGVETIGLYAYPHLVEFYKNLGFKPNSDFSVLTGKPVHSMTERKAKEAEKPDIPALIDFDSNCFGADRMKLLNQIFLEEVNPCYVSEDGDRITGYVVAKVYGETAEVGPMVCSQNRVEEAMTLAKAVITKLESLNVSMCVASKEAALLTMLSEAGLHKDFRVVRMFLGPAVATNCIYMAESLERG